MSATATIGTTLPPPAKKSPTVGTPPGSPPKVTPPGQQPMATTQQPVEPRPQRLAKEDLDEIVRRTGGQKPPTTPPTDNGKGGGDKPPVKPCADEKKGGKGTDYLRLATTAVLLVLLFLLLVPLFGQLQTAFRNTFGSTETVTTSNSEAPQAPPAATPPESGDPDAVVVRTPAEMKNADGSYKKKVRIGDQFFEANPNLVEVTNNRTGEKRIITVDQAAEIAAKSKITDPNPPVFRNTKKEKVNPFTFR